MGTCIDAFRPRCNKYRVNPFDHYCDAFDNDWIIYRLRKDLSKYCNPVWGTRRIGRVAPCLLATAKMRLPLDRPVRRVAHLYTLTTSIHSVSGGESSDPSILLPRQWEPRPANRGGGQTVAPRRAARRPSLLRGGFARPRWRDGGAGGGGPRVSGGCQRGTRPRLPCRLRERGSDRRRGRRGPVAAAAASAAAASPADTLVHPPRGRGGRLAPAADGKGQRPGLALPSRRRRVDLVPPHPSLFLPPLPQCYFLAWHW